MLSVDFCDVSLNCQTILFLFEKCGYQINAISMPKQYYLLVHNFLGHFLVMTLALDTDNVKSFRAQLFQGLNTNAI